MNVTPPPSHVRAGIRGSTVLVFQGIEDGSLVDLGVLLRDIETLYWLCVEIGEERAAEMRPRVKSIHFGSPLEITLELVEFIWRAGVGFTFIGALAMIFKLPARFEKDRWQFWQTRLAGDKAKREWIEWTQAQYRESTIHLDGLILPEEAETYPPPEEVERYRPPPPALQPNRVEQLKDLFSLKGQGVLTEEEFTAEITRILGEE